MMKRTWLLLALAALLQGVVVAMGLALMRGPAPGREAARIIHTLEEIR